MFSKIWLIIKDDSKKTFEVCGQASNENAFFNKTYAMQKAGMSVSCMTPPVTNATSSKELVKVISYKREDGLMDRLTKEFRDITMGYVED